VDISICRITAHAKVPAMLCYNGRVLFKKTLQRGGRGAAGEI